MSKNQRLASFRGPSTPVKVIKSPQTSPCRSPAPLTESTYHRKLRANLLDLRTAFETWEALVVIDGLKAAKALVDYRTELDNILSKDAKPRRELVGDKLLAMEQRILDLESVKNKLAHQLSKMSAVIDSNELVLREAYRTKGWAWVTAEPLWRTWSLEKFSEATADSVARYPRALFVYSRICYELRPHSISFDQSRDAINEWVNQATLDDAWKEMDEVFEVEIDGWGS